MGFQLGVVDVLIYQRLRNASMLSIQMLLLNPVVHVPICEIILKLESLFLVAELFFKSEYQLGKILNFIHSGLVVALEKAFHDREQSVSDLCVRMTSFESEPGDLLKHTHIHQKPDCKPSNYFS